MKIMIIGVNGGLGSRLVKDLHNLGHELILCSSKENQYLSKEHNKHIFIEVDFFKSDFLNKLEKNLENITPDAIVYCSGGTIKNDKHPIEVKTLENTLKLNLYGSIEINNLLIEKSLSVSKKLIIIHIGSSAGFDGNASPSYSIAKGALHTYIKNTSRKYLNSKIVLCGVSPSIFEHKNSIWSKRKKENPKEYNKRLSITQRESFPKAKDISEIVRMVIFAKTSILSGQIIEL